MNSMKQLLANEEKTMNSRNYKVTHLVSKYICSDVECQIVVINTKPPLCVVKASMCV